MRATCRAAYSCILFLLSTLTMTLFIRRLCKNARYTANFCSQIVCFSLSFPLLLWYRNIVLILQQIIVRTLFNSQRPFTCSVSSNLWIIIWLLIVYLPAGNLQHILFFRKITKSFSFSFIISDTIFENIRIILLCFYFLHMYPIARTCFPRSLIFKLYKFLNQ